MPYIMVGATEDIMYQWERQKYSNGFVSYHNKWSWNQTCKQKQYSRDYILELLGLKTKYSNSSLHIHLKKEC